MSLSPNGNNYHVFLYSSPGQEPALWQVPPAGLPCGARHDMQCHGRHFESNELHCTVLLRNRMPKRGMQCTAMHCTALPCSTMQCSAKLCNAV
eukprot:9192396-Lingulodinium_polyedra.AAC.1